MANIIGSDYHFRVSFSRTLKKLNNIHQYIANINIFQTVNYWLIRRLFGYHILSKNSLLINGDIKMKFTCTLSTATAIKLHYLRSKVQLISLLPVYNTYIVKAFDDMLKGKNAKGVIVFE